MTRFVPRAQADAIHRKPGTPLDYEWYRYLRGLGIDLDDAVDDGDTNAANLAIHEALTSTAHGWTLLTDKAIATGSNSIAHGLGYKPTQVVPVKDLAVPSYSEVYLSGAQSLPTHAQTLIGFDGEVADFGSCHSAGTFTAPHAGIYTIDAAAYLNYDLTIDTDRYIAAVCSSAGTLFSAYHQDGVQDKTIIAINETVILAANETVSIQAYHNTGASVPLSTGRGRTRATFRSDDACSEGTHDATNITIWSARTRTMSFLVR